MANKVRKVLTKPEYREFVEVNQPFYDWPDFLSVFLTSYLEDLVSGLGIWNAFIKENKKRTGRELPFVDLEEYYTEEINPQDVAFLLWFYKNENSESDYYYRESSPLVGLQNFRNFPTSLFSYSNGVPRCKKK